VKRYLKGFFLFDAILVITDWLGSYVIDTGAQTLRLGKSVSRGMRVVRILRLIKVRQSFSHLNERLNSESARVFTRIGQMLLVLVVFNHLMACVWFLIGDTGNGDYTWVMIQELEDRDVAYQYLTSLHWAVSQGAPASMEVNPTNAAERAFALVTVIVSLLTFSSFISSITANMSHLQAANGRRTMQMVVLRRYLSQHAVSSQLTHSVVHYIQSHFQQTGGNAHTFEHQVESLKLIPHSMRSELRWEAHSPVLLKHPLFWFYWQQSTAAMREVCDTAVKEVDIPIRHELFADKMASGITDMVFVIRGKLLYTYSYSHQPDGSDQAPAGDGEEAPAQNARAQASSRAEDDNDEVFEHVLIQGDWGCEAALWVQKFMMMKPFVALENTVSLLVHAAEFRTVARRYPQSCLCIASYADRYVEVIVEECSTTPWRMPVWPPMGMVNHFAKYAFGAAQRTTVRKSVMDVVPAFSHGFGGRRRSGFSGSSGKSGKSGNSK